MSRTARILSRVIVFLFLCLLAHYQHTEPKSKGTLSSLCIVSHQIEVAVLVRLILTLSQLFHRPSLVELGEMSAVIDHSSGMVTFDKVIISQYI